ncbi:unnamed protein product [Ambrosiozyma monospora]|uniref:Unnamed protein product n=1 Tax=Ambrosiozyma monospora TaxID=43982 RepID=A0ACB5TCA9_AMBMO|nr:unnamed protein product [Ambrosiozyma monospora]
MKLNGTPCFNYQDGLEKKIFKVWELRLPSIDDSLPAHHVDTNNWDIFQLLYQGIASRTSTPDIIDLVHLTRLKFDYTSLDKRTSNGSIKFNYETLPLTPLSLCESVYSSFMPRAQDHTDQQYLDWGDKLRLKTRLQVGDCPRTSLHSNSKPYLPLSSCNPCRVLQESSGENLNMVLSMDFGVCKRVLGLEVNNDVYPTKETGVVLKVLDLLWVREWLRHEGIYHTVSQEVVLKECREAPNNEILIYEHIWKHIWKHNQKFPRGSETLSMSLESFDLVRRKKKKFSMWVNSVTDTYVLGPYLVLEELKGLRHPGTEFENQQVNNELSKLRSIGVMYEDDQSLKLSTCNFNSLIP